MTDRPPRRSDRPEIADSPPPHAEAPVASVWPFVLSGGFALLLFGVVTSAAFSVLGVVLLVWAIGGWLGELRHE